MLLVPLPYVVSCPFRRVEDHHASLHYSPHFEESMSQTGRLRQAAAGNPAAARALEGSGSCIFTTTIIILTKGRAESTKRHEKKLN